jgi:hypothetical protein
MKIKAISTWQNGQEVLANEFVLSSSYDNLKNYAIFSYNLYNDSQNTMQDVLISGTLQMDEADYISWDAAINANEWAYNWAVAKLNLELLPE